MYVIFPADELLLMTYAAPDASRFQPRPTLDRLREPLVPYGERSYTTAGFLVNNTPIGTSTTPAPTLKGLTPAATTSPIHFSNCNYNCDTSTNVVYNSAQPLPPTPKTSTSHSLRKNGLNRSSVRSSHSKTPTPPQGVRLSATPTLTAKNVITTQPMNGSYDLSMRSAHSGSSQQQQEQQQQQQQQQQSVQRPTLQHSVPSEESSSLYGGNSEANGAVGKTRDRSPSIFVESPPSIPNPTATNPNYGYGWGRPMSPMDMPSEKTTTKTSPQPTKASRLRPKLHIPLGRLGRATSEQRESHRLREDLQLHVENPIFNSENLRQRNFDAFFESGEPVYKLQPKTAPPVVDNTTSSLDDHNRSDTSPRSRRSGGLFARSPREEKKTLSARSKSAEQYETPRSEREPSVCGTSIGGGNGSGNGDGVGGGSSTGVSQKDFLGKSSSGQKGRRFFGWRGPFFGSLNPQDSMASYNGVLKEFGHSSLNEAFKSQNNVNFKLIKTVSDFTESLSHLYEEHATALQNLVSNYRKKNGELRKERPACHLSIFQAWETFLQEVETDSQSCNDVASVLSRQVSRPMLDKSFHRKVQSRKIFTHRESFETIIAKTEEKLSKCRVEYKQTYLAHRQNPTQLSLTEYIDAHNAYVQQLNATNAMLETYHCETVPQLMQELEEIHNDLYSIVAESILQGADVIATKASDQSKRYNTLTVQCNNVSAVQDLTNFVRILPLPSNSQKVPKRIFAPPTLPATDTENTNDYHEVTPILRNELVFDRHSTLSLRTALDSLKREANDLETQIRQLQDSVDALNRTQLRGIEGQLYNKVNDMQEDLSMKKFDLRAKQMHLAAIKAQKELFVSKIDPGSPRGGERKLSIASPPSMKTKWLKAFKSLKPASGSAAQSDRRNGSSSQPLRPNEDGSHHLQEYTYKKITACDVCSQILRGHTRQGLRCRICKLNAHGDCAPQLPRCQPKQKLLRRQKSTSELENRVEVVDEEKPTDIDQLYRVLKQGGKMKSGNIAADKFAHQSTIKSDGSIAATTIATAPPLPPDIEIMNIPDYPERRPAMGATTTTTATGATVTFNNNLSAGSGSGGGLSMPRRAGVRTETIAMPILGVQLQQQELQQQRGGLPVPAQDISSSSGLEMDTEIGRPFGEPLMLSRNLARDGNSAQLSQSLTTSTNGKKSSTTTTTAAAATPRKKYT